MKKNMSLYMLPDEILLIIFNYCDTCDLLRLNSVCKKFYNIISTVLIKRSDHLLVTGQMSAKFCKRCQPLLSSSTSKFCTNHMWHYGNYEKKIIYTQSKLVGTDCSNEYWSNILMTNDTIVLGHMVHRPRHHLCAINRTKNGSLSDNWLIERCNSKIMVMVLCNDVIVSSHQDNSIREWTIKSLRERKYLKQKLLRSSDYVNELTYSMDVTSRNMITSPIKGIIKMWNYTPQKDTIIEEIKTLNLNELDDKYCVSSLAFDFTGTKFAANCRSQNSAVNCIIYDVNNCSTEKYKKIDVNATDVFSNLYQLLWEDPNTILSLGRNKILKMDVRIQKVVNTWSSLDYPEYTQGGFTCMSSDNLYAIMTGMSNGQVVLWDQRQRCFTQRYNICNSAIQNLEFDSSHMFTVGKEIYELDFTKYSSHVNKVNFIKKLYS